MGRSWDHCPQSKGQRPPSGSGKSKAAVGPHRSTGGLGRATRPTTPSSDGALRLAPHAGGGWRGTHQVGVCGGARREWSNCRVGATRGPQRCALATANNEETTTWISHRWWRGGTSSMGLQQRARPWGDRGTIAHALRASALRRRVGEAREGWGRIALLAVGVAPHARPSRPMLAPFPSRHMQVANGAA